MPGQSAPREPIPQVIRDLADARARARRSRDWATADALRAQIEAAGWRVVDAASLYSLERAHPPDVVDADVTYHGWSGSVPSRLEDPPTGVASVVLVAADPPDDLARALRALERHSPAGTQVVVVVDAQTEAGLALALAGLPAPDAGAPRLAVEVVRTAHRLGPAAARNAGIRRAVGPVVILFDPGVEPGGDLVSALSAALADPGVAVSGPVGLVSDDLRRFAEAPAGTRDAVAIAGDAMAFRRSDYLDRGPLDEHFATPEQLDAWWSLILRDPEAGAGAGDHPADLPDAPRRAVVVTDVSIIRHGRRTPAEDADPERARAAKRDHYRLLKRFATRRDLLVPAASGGAGDRG